MNSRVPFELHMLRQIFDVCDSPPEHLRDSAYAAPNRAADWTRACALELISDSAEAPEPATRGDGEDDESRVLTFVAPGRVIEMDLIPQASGVMRASGMVLGKAGSVAATGQLVLRHPTGECVGDLDEHGAFRIGDVPRGPLSVVFRTQRSEPAVADWLIC